MPWSFTDARRWMTQGTELFVDVDVVGVHVQHPVVGEGRPAVPGTDDALGGPLDTGSEQVCPLDTQRRSTVEPGILQSLRTTNREDLYRGVTPEMPTRHSRFCSDLRGDV